MTRTHRGGFFVYGCVCKREGAAAVETLAGREVRGTRLEVQAMEPLGVLLHRRVPHHAARLAVEAPPMCANTQQLLSRET